MNRPTCQTCRYAHLWVPPQHAITALIILKGLRYSNGGTAQDKIDRLLRKQRRLRKLTKKIYV